jgi:hypothetical protein
MVEEMTFWDDSDDAPEAEVAPPEPFRVSAG